MNFFATNVTQKYIRVRVTQIQQKLHDSFIFGARNLHRLQLSSNI